MINHKLFFISHLILSSIICLLAENLWPSILLVSAQIVYIPTLFQLIVAESSFFRKNYWYIAIPAYLALALIAIFPSAWNGALSIIYLLFTAYIALAGIQRFMQRGFTHMEEFAIDCGMIFLFVGGLWYVAYHFGIDTGFSPLLTWLTAIHFHYSAYMMLIFTGLLGRIRKTKFYPLMTVSMIVLPWIMAAGISLTRWIEISGIILYILTIFYIIIQSIHTRKWLPSLAFATTGITIIFSALYILSNGFGIGNTTIDWMLLFHGITNSLGFGLIGVIGWLLADPKAIYQTPNFPLSPIRRKFLPAEGSRPVAGLVDELSIYVPAHRQNEMTDQIKDFYEHTGNYKLEAKVHWAKAFMPFAFVYKAWSSLVEQINLPLSSKTVEMTGAILHVDEGENGRKNVRAWIRKIAGKLVFVALYSSHQKGERTYMNIALPLPLTSMHGILACQMTADGLELTSVCKDETMEDAGIYLATGKKGYFRLPLTETFFVKEVDDRLVATHDMEIFGMHFLHIDYQIERKQGSAE